MPLHILTFLAGIIVMVATFVQSAADGASPASTDSKENLRNRPLTQHELPSTSGRIFMHNIDLERNTLELWIPKRANDIQLRQHLSSLNYICGVCRDDLNLIQRGVDILDECLQSEPDNPTIRLLHARQHFTMHRFPSAQVSLELAKKCGADVNEVAKLQIEMDWQQGVYDKAIPAIRMAARVNRSVESVARLAKLEEELGNIEVANTLYEEAEDLIVDTNPIVVAWLNIQRGRLKLVSQQFNEAEAFFREAIRRCPDYVGAHEGLVESMICQRRLSDAVISVEALAARTSNNPEIHALLATVYREAGREKESLETLAKASEWFNQLLVKYPEAMSWHAAEFYLTDGNDFGRALKLLEYNVSLRPNSESWVALAQAQLANGQIAAARTSVNKALAMPLRSVELKRLLLRTEFEQLIDGVERK